MRKRHGPRHLPPARLGDEAATKPSATSRSGGLAAAQTRTSRESARGACEARTAKAQRRA
ncbi:hypothetical protein PSMK_20700 [Phycisphaera mikurensis NBRC 102666]|uniref:Uncharacterized protein n=1 Tax=Phycisphaera mikurensis (strain NBRC 102666 / KCTC 22515 / FYK2301M01) TaxID=1142394 RepID=I0IG41_PHYMF|nr:hypothetical protein PSMK_20700 [Phycisphaera mikurensis NBRC 102666]